MIEWIVVSVMVSLERCSLAKTIIKLFILDDTLNERAVYVYVR